MLAVVVTESPKIGSFSCHPYTASLDVMLLTVSAHKALTHCVLSQVWLCVWAAEHTFGRAQEAQALSLGAMHQSLDCLSGAPYGDFP